MNDTQYNSDFNISIQTEAFIMLGINLIIILFYPFILYRYLVYGLYYGIVFGIIFSLITSKYLTDNPYDDTNIYKKFRGIFYANISILIISILVLLIIIYKNR